MIDSIFSLRFLLLIIGAAIVAAIYLWGTRKNNRNTRIKYDSRRTSFEPKRRGAEPASTVGVGPPLDIDDDSGESSVQTAAPILLQEPPQKNAELRISTAHEAPLDIPKITRTGKASANAGSASRPDNQMELTFDDESGAASSAPASPNETIVALYVKAPGGGREFAGPAIVKAMNMVGLRYGDMDIYHHFGAGELATEEPLFSVANMVEPGSFKLDNIERFSTPGLAMFLRLPSALDGAVAFELFLNTAQRLAEALAGDLYSAPDKLLDGIMIDEMRQTAVVFAHGR